MKQKFKLRHKKVQDLHDINDSKAFIEYSNDMDDIYKNTEECNPNKKRKILIVFHDMIADMVSNKKRNPTVIELFIRGTKLNICLVIITQCFLAVPRNNILNSTHILIMKNPNKQEF